MTPRPVSFSRQGNYAGPISRLVAFVLDIIVAWVVIVLIFASVDFAISLMIGKPINLRHIQYVAVVVIPLWFFLYFAYQWALGGKTVGMAIFGIRVMTAEGAPIRGRQAVIRTLTFPLSFLAVGLGLLGIILRVDHRAWHDRFASTCVVYDWDARAARLRWLARQQESAQIQTPSAPPA